MKKNLIAISGKIGSGKDTVGSIFNYLCQEENWDSYGHYLEESGVNNDDYQIKKFAELPKNIVCLLIGCTREQLEDREFKEKELGEEWWYYGAYQHGSHSDELISIHADEKDAKYILDYSHMNRVKLVKLTPRLLLQLLGTEAGRDIIHPNIWVNALFADYKPRVRKEDITTSNGNKDYFRVHTPKNSVSNWIITDCRFPNEAQAIKDKGGIVIRVNRKMTSEEWQKLYPEVIVLDPDGWNRDERYQYEWYEEKITLEEYKSRVMRSTCKFKVDFQNYFKEHPSETALDNYEFDYVIDNNGSIEELVEKVKQLNLV